jgi:hypothetical protein
MSVSEDFDQFNRNLRVSNQEVIRRRYRTITKRLNIDYWDSTSETDHSLYVGSYGRNTAIDGFSDLDVMMRLPDDVWLQYHRYVGNGQSALLQVVKSSLRQEYPTTNLRGDGQVVVVSFSDGMKIEVLPVFSATYADYYFPNTNDGGSWEMTSPKAEQRAFSEINKQCSGNLVKLCRMMRAWRREWNVSIGGILLDTLAANFLQQYEYRANSSVYFDWMCRDFLKYLRDQNPHQNVWSPLVGHGLVYRRGPFEYRAGRCFDIAVEACENYSNNWHNLARSEWRKIFGSFFPS